MKKKDVVKPKQYQPIELGSKRAPGTYKRVAKKMGVEMRNSRGANYNL